jgi:hypothetical protein
MGHSVSREVAGRYRGVVPLESRGVPMKDKVIHVRVTAADHAAIRAAAEEQRRTIADYCRLAIVALAGGHATLVPIRSTRPRRSRAA